MSTYTNVQIRVLARENLGYPVEVEIDHGQQFLRTYLDAETVTTLAYDGDRQESGQRLWQWLMADKSLHANWLRLSQQKPQRRICLRFDETPSELFVLPWELLHDGTAYLSTDINTPFSRYLAGSGKPLPPISNGPIRIMAVIANPKGLKERYNLQSINVDKEWESLLAATSDSRYELIRLDPPVTLATLEAELQKGFHILHYVGHTRVTDSGRNAILYLADEQNQVTPVRDIQFVAMLIRLLGKANIVADAGLRLIYISSYQTAERYPTDAHVSLAPQLIQAGVSAVLDTQNLVPFATAHTFTRIFYEQLITHGMVDLATNKARAHILTSDAPERNLPILYSRLRDGQLSKGNLRPRSALDEFDETERMFYNGINGLTGEYFFDPVSTLDLANIAQGREMDQDHLEELRDRASNPDHY